NQYIYRKYLPTFLIVWAFKKPESGCSANGVLKLRAIIRMFFSCVYPAKLRKTLEILPFLL
ncbi:MAG: hypothetical protein IJR83_04200, partial [Clostridia bacterium]|nr:hypothetical protein [Clostridia bacterium]